MIRKLRGLWIGGLAGLALATGAFAQETNTVIGPPQLRDFDLRPTERLVTQPPPQAQPPAEIAPPPPARAQPSAERPAAPRTASPAAPEARAETAPPAQPAPPPADEPAGTDLAPPPAPAVEAPLPAPAGTAPATETGSGPGLWVYALPAAALALLGLMLVRRRRRNGEDEPAAETLSLPVAAAPRPEPTPRPWLEIELKAERASFDPAEAVVHFELEIRNTGPGAARDLRIDVKMFNAGREQDKEIGAFFRTAGRETARLKLPGIGAGRTGVIRGEVGMAIDEMRAVRMNDRMLFVPVIALNILYDWGEGRTGQTAKSYVIGRELQEPSEKMGAFRVDQGPRVWRTVGQRQHKLARRV